MTAITYTHEPGIPKVGLVLFMAFIVAVMALLFGALSQVPAPVAAAIKLPPVVYEEHAEIEHGIDAVAVRQCLNDKGGADQIWRSFQKDRYYLLCGFPDGRWGFMVIEEALDGKWHEVTSFIRKNPSLNALRDYLSRCATKFNGPYPWAP